MARLAASTRRFAQDAAAWIRQDVRALSSVLCHPFEAYRALRDVPERVAARRFAASAPGAPPAALAGPPGDLSNPLRAYFEQHREGRGLYKWLHYFEIYHRHFARFVGQQPHVVEIGVYSGGSLEMWQQYFGADCRVTGVDLLESCRAYAPPGVEIAVGDQADRRFWERFRATTPPVDILIDDGGHTPEQQRVTLEELLLHLKPGGVYLCEDILGGGNAFAAYVAGLADQLNVPRLAKLHRTESGLGCRTTGFQSRIGSIHLYPYVVVIERSPEPIAELASLRRGSQWHPH